MKKTPDRHLLDLTELEPGQSGILVRVAAGAGLVRRLDAMGIRIGKRLTKVSGMPLGGPVVIQVGGTRVGLGRGMARKILVEPYSPPRAGNP
jgi:Fe2+ transport system protein FeoA